MTIYANVYGGQLTVDLNGTGAASGVVTLTPSTVSFGGWKLEPLRAAPGHGRQQQRVGNPHQQRLHHRLRSPSPATPAAQPALRRTAIAR